MKKNLFMLILMHLLFLSISVNVLQLDNHKIFDNLDDSLLFKDWKNYDCAFVQTSDTYSPSNVLAYGKDNLATSKIK